MKIAFLNRGRETMEGGDCIALDATMAALRKRGIECEETGWDRQRMKNGNFDLAHISTAISVGRLATTKLYGMSDCRTCSRRSSIRGRF